jgi:hypothetical protein
MSEPIAQVTSTMANKNCFPIISYVLFIVVYIMSFICIYKRNVALLGVMLLYIINIIYSVFLMKDMFLWTKSEQIITFIITAILLLNLVSSSLIIMTLRTLHAKYNKNGETIKLAPQNQARISQFFTMFICTIVFVWVLAIYYFVEGEGVEYFSFVFIGQNASPGMLVAKFLMKISLSITSLGLSGYMVYLANKLSKLRRSQLQ